MIRRPPRSTPFPTRRSSDLPKSPLLPQKYHVCPKSLRILPRNPDFWGDRKSTRLNSSHVAISYAVFCLKKKKKKKKKIDITITHMNQRTSRVSVVINRR